MLKQELERVKNAIIDDGSDVNQMYPLRWADFKTKYARKALKIAVIFTVLNACSRAHFLATHFMLRLKQGHEWSVLIVAFVAALGSYLAIQYVDRVGRKVKQMLHLKKINLHSIYLIFRILFARF